jgi:hypothetical protein
MPDTFEGGCACRAVRYRMLSSPLYVHCCHCTECQCQSGGAFAVNALIETNRVQLLSGKPAPAVLPTESGRGQTVLRCPDCGTTLWSHYAGAGPQVAFVRVGTLDDPSALPPDIHIYTRSKLRWVPLPAGARAVAEYYDRNECWPPESLRRAALAKRT